MKAPIRGIPSRPLQYAKAISNSDLPTTTRTVCWAIASFANNTTGQAYPSLRALSKATGLSTATISKHTILAESQGYLLKHQRFNNSIWYVITTPPSGEPEPVTMATGDEPEVHSDAWFRKLYGLDEPTLDP
ncbi:helix-turn-helix domain-containing protein [Paenarthrobacter sp. Y-19]|uniref:helix-turn-helix domain-containing protein n=1 Tax=Paenarthrobacter sp. Y-19 TaxID=3031125 RepID=UPI0023DC355D|nr:helix-turn-helix domain-containing protein [Paenarthrobacter sp. Y-19]